MDNEELEKRFTYHAPKNDIVKGKYDGIRNEAKEYAKLLIKICPESRELSVALTHLETAVMWANASIARNE